MKRAILFLTVLALGLTSSFAQAAITTVPTGLNPGDQYYLAFVTSGGTTASSSAISFYDAFVNAQADSSPSQAVRDITWLALGSTQAVDAITHLNIAAHPIYLLDGTTMIATGGADLWDGSILHGLTIDQNGALFPSVAVWTGTDQFGVRLDPLGSQLVTSGSATAIDASWVAYGGTDANDFPDGNLYGFSELLTVPTATVPEPVSLAVWSVLAGCVVVYGARRVHRQPTPPSP
jgi:hypothetical protein